MKKLTLFYLFAITGFALHAQDASPQAEMAVQDLSHMQETVLLPAILVILGIVVTGSVLVVSQKHKKLY